MLRSFTRILWCLALSLAAVPARAGSPQAVTAPPAAAESRVTPQGDPAWEAYAHARLALEARARGDEDGALREFQRAMQLDPQWASPHFSIAWYNLGHDPAAAPSEFFQGVRLWIDSFRNQDALLFHLLLWSLLAAFLALVGLAVSAVLIALPETHHRTAEFLARFVEPSYASVIAALLLVLPFAMGTGLIIPLLFLLALQQPLLRGTGRRVWGFLLVATLSLPWLIRETDSLLLPRTPDSWVGRVSLASRSRWSPELANSLRETEAQARGRYEVPLARGLMALRAQRFDEALAQLRRADSLSHGDPRVLNNLGVAAWMLGRGFAAESAFTSATQVDDRLTSAHYNLAQVLARRLAFEDANREMLRGGALDFDRLRRHFNANGAGRSAMMLEEPSPASLWQLWKDETSLRADWTESPQWLWRFWESRTLQFAVVAFITLLVGSIAGRRLRRWLPVQSCANCGSMLCRRCSGRRKGQTLCQVCFGHLTSTSGGPFGRILMERRRVQISHERGLVQTVVAVVLPPLGRALEGRWMLAGLEWFGLCFLALITLKGGFWIHPGPNLSGGLHSTPAIVTTTLIWLACWGPLAAREALQYKRRTDPALDERPAELEEAA